MTVWLEQKGNIHQHYQYIDWQLKRSPPSPQVEWTPLGLEINRTLKLAKLPTAQLVSLDNLVTKYGATYFSTALAHFVVLTNDPKLTCAQLEQKVWGIHFPFTKFPIWHCIKFV